ncbi:GGDEF domain-containing protein [Croceibacterium sp. TMG7-5b_MA50]|uniref:GGDEF domain-containing protein n=1 Tax=Croceibacterium sp. TMG7-5b_MA50 TaxID=3121290 RepID=UPI0032219385
MAGLVDAAGLQFAFQPIVAMGTLEPQGFEALARLPDGHDPATACDLLDLAASEGRLIEVDLALAAAAVASFAEQELPPGTRLFCNIDPRLLQEGEHLPLRLAALARDAGIAPGSLVVELCGTDRRLSPDLLRIMAKHGLRVALSGFGNGAGDIACLLGTSPDYLKLDGDLTSGVARNTRAQAVVAKLIGLGHALGIPSVAVQVEQEADFRTLRELGCDMAQGFLTGRPTRIPQMADTSGVAGRLRRDGGIPRRIADMVIAVEPLHHTTPLADAVARFRQGVALGMLPVVDAGGHVMGALYEAALNAFLFSGYGAALVENRGLRQTAGDLAAPCPTAEATATVEAIIESAMAAPDARGIVLTVDGRLAGMLSSQHVLQLSSERAVEEARDRNPLTGLPGNGSIQRFLLRSAVGHPHSVVFFDFDNFKAFNDAYGFTEGDRIILHFADVLQAAARDSGGFVGHVGGDDFFACFPVTEDAAESLTRQTVNAFRLRAEAHYSEEHRSAGGFRAKDRFGEHRFFPLIRAAAVLLHLPADRPELTPEEIVGALAEGKSAAKASVEGLHRISLPALLAQRVNRRGDPALTGTQSLRSSFLAEPAVASFATTPGRTRAPR